IAGTEVYESIVRRCEDLCRQGSLNFGYERRVWNSTCCSTNLCNNHPANPNGKKCFTCKGGDCTGTLNCLGDEDRCFTATGDTLHKMIFTKGCASQKICSIYITPGLSPYDYECCEGDFCNGESMTLLSFDLYSMCCTAEVWFYSFL
uniref:Uncharacterized protein n=1 Tax=Salarias fasciatus TaxID=181472 RepID=A0A672HXX6_SALFA